MSDSTAPISKKGKSKQPKLKRRRSMAPPPSSIGERTPAPEDLDEDAALEDGEDDDGNDGDDRFKFAAEDLEEDEPQPSTSTHQTTLPSHLLPASHTKSKPTPGLIYLSRIPPGMGPSKVKHLLEAYGETGRVYLVRADAKSGKAQSTKHQSHNFVEGWIEFLDKRIARSVAEMLNAQPIPSGNGKKGNSKNKWRDDVWTMKYLPRFRWDMLSEQFALEKATQTQLLRFHLSNSRTEQETYLSQVERKRVGEKIEEKRSAKGEGEGKKRKAEAEDGKEEKKRKFRQREGVDLSKKRKMGGGAADDGGLDGVLGKLF